MVVGGGVCRGGGSVVVVWWVWVCVCWGGVLGGCVGEVFWHLLPHSPHARTTSPPHIHPPHSQKSTGSPDGQCSLPPKASSSCPPNSERGGTVYSTALMCGVSTRPPRVIDYTRAWPAAAVSCNLGTRNTATLHSAHTHKQADGPGSRPQPSHRTCAAK